LAPLEGSGTDISSRWTCRS